MYDLIIIGSGPAGLTAGIYAARRELKTLIIGRELGGQLIWASEIANYPGFKMIKNFELITKMQEQVKDLGVEIKSEEVKRIKQDDNKTFTVFTEKNNFQSKSIIVALGLSPRRLAIPGEVEFTGKGVSYCANCDGPFYKNKIVSVVGGGNAALDAAEVLSKISQKVYLIHRRKDFRGFETLVDEVKTRTNVEFVLDSEVKNIIGNNVVQSIEVINNVTNQKRVIEVNGVFIEIGRIANTDLVGELVKRNEKNEILVSEKCETSRPGIFAAGDVTQIAFKQITIACGQGTIAALAAYQYLQMQKGQKADLVLDRSIKK